MFKQQWHERKYSWLLWVYFLFTASSLKSSPEQIRHKTCQCPQILGVQHSALHFVAYVDSSYTCKLGHWCMSCTNVVQSSLLIFAQTDVRHSGAESPHWKTAPMPQNLLTLLAPLFCSSSMINHHDKNSHQSKHPLEVQGGFWRISSAPHPINQIRFFDCVSFKKTNISGT